MDDRTRLQCIAVFLMGRFVKCNHIPAVMSLIIAIGKTAAVAQIKQLLIIFTAHPVIAVWMILI